MTENPFTSNFANLLCLLIVRENENCVNSMEEIPCLKMELLYLSVQSCWQCEQELFEAEQMFVGNSNCKYINHYFKVKTIKFTFCQFHNTTMLEH